MRLAAARNPASRADDHVSPCAVRRGFLETVSKATSLRSFGRARVWVEVRTPIIKYSVERLPVQPGLYERAAVGRSSPLRPAVMRYNRSMVAMNGNNTGQEDDPLVLLYVPCGSEEEAASIASALLSEHLIACANMYTSRSLYRWQGSIADEQEFVLICKTLASRSDAARQRIETLHSYDVPCVLEVIPAMANEAFYKWAATELTAPSDMVAASSGQDR